jgi:UDP-GlcNAc:undecaprenyl-phosphate GlcNAc-1-phosphate transferase
MTPTETIVNDLSLVDLALPFFAGALICWIISAIVIRFATQFGILRQVGGHRRHTRETPLFGGVGIFLALMAGSLLVFYHPAFERWKPQISSLERFAWLGSLSLVFLLGFFDDIRPMQGRTKLFVQLIAATLMVYSSQSSIPQIEGLRGGFLYFGLILFSVTLMNAINFIDGLDGLCSGVTLISSLTLIVIRHHYFPGGGFESFILACLAGTVFGFLFHNFHPARIFLGDTGSLLIGFTISAFCTHLAGAALERPSIAQAIFLCLFIPLLDLSVTIYRRISLNRPIFASDWGHFHHRIRQLGLTHRNSVYLLWCLQMYGSLAALCVALPEKYATIWLSFFPAALPLSLLLVLGFIEKRMIDKNMAVLGSQTQAELKPGGLENWIQIRMREGLPFKLISLDCTVFLKEMNARSMSKVHRFVSELSIAIYSQIRQGDQYGWLSNRRIAIGVAYNSEDESVEKRVTLRIAAKVKLILKEHDVFVSEAKLPDGWQSLSFPEDSLAIIRLLEKRQTESSDENAA